jgi:hypothetical protein
MMGLLDDYSDNRIGLLRRPAQFQNRGGGIGADRRTIFSPWYRSRYSRR